MGLEDIQEEEPDSRFAYWAGFANGLAMAGRPELVDTLIPATEKKMASEWASNEVVLDAQLRILDQLEKTEQNALEE